MAAIVVFKAAIIVLVVVEVVSVVHTELQQLWQLERQLPFSDFWQVLLVPSFVYCHFEEGQRDVVKVGDGDVQDRMLLEQTHPQNPD